MIEERIYRNPTALYIAVQDPIERNVMDVKRQFLLFFDETIDLYSQ